MERAAYAARRRWKRRERVENGLERRGEECDLGEVEGKGETHILSFSLSPFRVRTEFLLVEVVLIERRGTTAASSTTTTKRKTTKRKEGAGGRGEGEAREEKEGNLSRVECNGGAGFG